VGSDVAVAAHRKVLRPVQPDVNEFLSQYTSPLREVRRFKRTVERRRALTVFSTDALASAIDAYHGAMASAAQADSAARISFDVEFERIRRRLYDFAASDAFR
jgi:hypothetical protein